MKKNAILDIEITGLAIKLFGGDFKLYDNNNNIELEIDLGVSWKSKAATAGRYDIETVRNHINKLKYIFISDPYLVNGIARRLFSRKQSEIPTILVLRFPESGIFRLRAALSLINNRINITIYGKDIA